MKPMTDDEYASHRSLLHDYEEYLNFGGTEPLTMWLRDPQLSDPVKAQAYIDWVASRH